MPIDYRQLRSLTVRVLLHALIKDGFALVKKKGATRLFRHADGRRVTLHVHKLGQTLKIGTLQEIIKNEAQWTIDDLKRLKLIP
jgi:predicted RNA binding protein YcfA (HicA-like mRNA interferase family)